jgi:TusA-related sulfurtransferase
MPIGPVLFSLEIDARGSHCPGPLMELIRGLKSAHEGEVIAVISSDLPTFRSGCGNRAMNWSL